MAEETQEVHDDRGAAATLSRAPLNASTSRLNAAAPAFVPRSAAAAAAAAPRHRAAKIHRALELPLAPPHAAAIQAFPVAAPPLGRAILVPVPNHGAFEYYDEEFEVAARVAAEPSTAPPPEEGLPEAVIRKIKKQVEYYFSDANLATTEILMRFISKDPEGFVPISVVASFKKIRALVHDNSLLAAALSTSTQLHVSDDGKKVRRKKPFTEADLEEVQSRIIFAENLPENHCYQNLMRVFSAVGSVKSIRTCYPQNSDGTTAAVNRSSKNDMVLCNKVHAFVEYETVEDAKIAVNKLNGETNWRNGLRVRPLLDCMKHGTGRGRKDGHEGDGARDGDFINTINQPKEKQADDEAHFEHHDEENFVDKEGGTRRGRGQDRGGKCRGKGQHHHYSTNRNIGHAVGTPPLTHPMHPEHPTAATKQPPGPRMPDGTRGFTFGRGKPITNPISSS
ncbi:la-related protein 6B-like [Ananas comosus]|uniref:La-related protein 6B-like n=1 Tax=Ananas comosus TaxID=4615 RepID=A0A6P5F0F3_ANACO|nr:la-related protein 6B-like [Ananas comosus]